MVNYPTSLYTNATLYVAVNNLRTQLTASINSSTLTIPVTSTAGFPSSGFITILTGSTITAAEAIQYTSIGSTQFNASLRGADGTTAVPHNSGDNVDLTVVAAHHNTLKDAVIAIEGAIGVVGSTPITNNFAANTVVASGSLTVSGIAINIKALVGAGQTTVTSGVNTIIISTPPGAAIVGAGGITITSGTNTISIASAPVPAIVGGSFITVVSGSNSTQLIAEAITGVGGITVISGTNTVAVSGTIFPQKATLTFTTVGVTAGVGIVQIDVPFGANRALVRRLKVTPNVSAVNAFVVEFYGSSSYAFPTLQYRATANSTYIDNYLCFFESLDQTQLLHCQINNKSNSDSVFTVNMTYEEFA